MPESAAPSECIIAQFRQDAHALIFEDGRQNYCDALTVRPGSGYARKCGHIIIPMYFETDGEPTYQEPRFNPTCAIRRGSSVKGVNTIWSELLNDPEGLYYPPAAA